MFFRSVASVHPRFQTPHVAVAMLAVLTVINASVRTFEQLAETFVLLFYPFIALSVAADFVLRRSRPELESPYRTWGYPVVPAIFLVGTLAMLGNAVVERTDSVLLALGIVTVGVPAYFIWRRA
jgi:amino acid transporter